MRKTRISVLCLSLVSLGTAWQARAQSFDNTGDGKLTGNYYFREVYFSGNGQDATAIYGEITFNGSGTYTLTSVSGYDYSQGPITLNTTTGSYTVSASGLGYLSNPLVSGDQIVGLVGYDGIFISSSTGSTIDGGNDMLIAAPIGSTTSPPFSGTYSVAFADLLDGFSASFQLTPNGSNVGNVNVTYYLVSSTGTVGSGSASEGTVSYKATNGAEVLNFPTNNQNAPIQGTEYLYISPDGNFIFGGGADFFDMFVGVKATSTPTFSGLYYQAGLDLSPDGYYGSLVAFPGGTLEHQRNLSYGTTQAYDDTYSNAVSLSGGSYSDYLPGGQMTHVFGAGGAISIAYGTDGYAGINVALQAPSFSGSGMYLNPTGIQNQGSAALFTSGIAPGEWITLTGTGLVSTTVSSTSFPTTLGNIELLVNGRPAPIYEVCHASCEPDGSDLILAVVPWELTGSIAQFQAVSTGGTRSNAVTLFTSQTAPGVETQCACGLGDAAAQHSSNFTTITPNNPAQIGETIVLYAVGLGAVSPTLNDGQPAGTTIDSITLDPLSIYFDDSAGNSVQATSISYLGLVPGEVNLYQIDVTVPSGIVDGETAVEIVGPDSDTFQATVAIGTNGLATEARPLAKTNPRLMQLHHGGKRLQKPANPRFIPAVN